MNNDFYKQQMLRVWYRKRSDGFEQCLRNSYWRPITISWNLDKQQNNMTQTKTFVKE